jgi:DNA-binding MarR family transcriptional regulator
MPPIQDMTSAAPSSGKTSSGLPDDVRLLDALQHQVAVFARRAEQTRLGGVGQVRNSMDRAAYLLLNRLDQEGPMGVKALAAGMGIDSSTVTRQVAPLVDTGLVKRTSHPEDGRAVVLQLSARGQSRLEEVRASRRELMAQVTNGWSEDERDAFTTLLTRFNTSLSVRQAGAQSADAPDVPDRSEGADGASGERTPEAGEAGTSPAGGE